MSNGICRRMNVAAACAILTVLAMAGAGLAADPTPSRPAALKLAEERSAKVADRFERTWTWYALAEETSITDPAKAADMSDKLESWTAKRDLLAVVMYAWGKADPKAAADWGVKFKERTKGDLAAKNTALLAAVVGMVAKEPKLADELIWKHLQDEGWGGHPRTAPTQAARELARSDPAAALAMAEKIQMESNRNDALRAVAREWAKVDPKAAVAAMSDRKEKGLKSLIPRDLAEGWACKDPKAAAEFAKAIPDQDHQTKLMAVALVALEMAKTDPAAAAELCQTVAALNKGKWTEQSDRVGLAVAQVGQALAKADPQAAVKWAASLPTGEGSVQRGAYDGVAAGWATKDPKAALEFYQVKGEGKDAGGNKGTGAAYPAIARELAKTDVDGALALVEKAKSLVLKSNIVAEVAVELAKRDPKAASAVVDKWAGITDYYTYRTGAAEVVAGTWAKKDPKAAAAWAQGLTPDTDRLVALRAVAAAWARAEPSAADNWAQGLKDPREAAYALIGVAEGLR